MSSDDKRVKNIETALFCNTQTRQVIKGFNQSLVINPFFIFIFFVDPIAPYEDDDYLDMNENSFTPKM